MWREVRWIWGWGFVLEGLMRLWLLTRLRMAEWDSRA